MDRDLPWTEAPRKRSPRQRPPWKETPSGQRPLLAQRPPRQRPSLDKDQDPPVERQTPVKTLPSQTSFAGGKYADY